MNSVRPGKVFLSRQLFELMREHVKSCAPQEACGIVAGKSGHGIRVYPIANALHSPIRYRMEPAEQVKVFLELEAQGLDLLAIYHSHPDGPEFPSQTDLAEFAYPGVLSLIWYKLHKRWQCKSYWIYEGKYEETVPWESDL